VLTEARAVGERLAGLPLDWLQARTQQRLCRSIGITEEPSPPCDDPELAYFAPGSVVRTLHGDLPSMLIGGLASLLLQSLHPLAMAGVAEHSRYQDDPLGRLERTARFVGVTTFGSTADAEVALSSVRRIHRHVRGTYDGVPYRASTPELLEWVHVAELHSFLASAQRYGPHRFTLAQRDAYVDEMAKVALSLGAHDVPHSVAELDERLRSFRPALRLTPEAKTARNFVLRGVARWPHELASYQLLVSASQGCLPGWARRQLHLVRVPATDALVVRPVAVSFCSALRLLATPRPSQRGEGPRR
jgi:uncharacterized protein (DUF2236 family)